MLVRCCPPPVNLIAGVSSAGSHGPHPSAIFGAFIALNAHGAPSSSISPSSRALSSPLRKAAVRSGRWCTLIAKPFLYVSVIVAASNHGYAVARVLAALRESLADVLAMANSRMTFERQIAVLRWRRFVFDGSDIEPWRGGHQLQ